MIIFQWSPELETGIALIDQQHMQLVETANSYFIQYKCGKEKEATRDCAYFLKHYVLYHYPVEESYQVQCGYPGYRSHQARHSALATQLKFLTVRLESTDYAEKEMAEFHAFMTSWIKQHLKVVDLEFIRFWKQYQKAHPVTARPLTAIDAAPTALIKTPLESAGV